MAPHDRHFLQSLTCKGNLRITVRRLPDWQVSNISWVARRCGRLAGLSPFNISRVSEIPSVSAIACAKICGPRKWGLHLGSRHDRNIDGASRTDAVMKAEYQGIELDWSARTDVGRTRELNEDSVVASPPVFVVADGMGGHDAGEVASALTTHRLRSFEGALPPEIDEVASEFQTIHTMLRSASVEGGALDMGTTAVGLFVTQQAGLLTWLLVNIGDSRGYVVSDGAMHQVTTDHSYVQELVDAGEIAPAAAREHPQRNVITQALGAMELAKPDFWVRPIQTGERFLLCSDGLTSEVSDDEIESILVSQLTPDGVSAMLTSLALERGGHDNVTVCVIDVVRAPESGAASTETRPPAAGHQNPLRGASVVTNDELDSKSPAIVDVPVDPDTGVNETPTAAAVALSSVPGMSVATVTRRPRSAEQVLKDLIADVPGEDLPPDGDPALMPKGVVALIDSPDSLRGDDSA